MIPRRLRALCIVLLVAANPLPARASTRPTRALHQLRAGHIDEAVILFREALAADPKSALLATDLAFAEQLRGHTTDADQLFRRAIELDPHRWYAYANLASMRAGAALGAGERDSLMALLERGLALQQAKEAGRPGLLLAMADVERAAGNLGAGRARLAEAQRLALTSGQARRAAALMQAFDAAEVKRSELRAVEEWPEPAIPLELLAQLASAERDLEKDPQGSLHEAERLSAAHRTWRGPRWLRARALLALEQLDAGTRELEALLRLDPAQASAWRLLGETLAAHGGPFEAARADAALRRALELEPAWTELWELRGRVLFRSGQVDEAKRALERAAAELQAAGEPLPEELASLLSAVRAKSDAQAQLQAGAPPEPTPAARALLREAAERLDAGDAWDANDRLSRALADSPALVDAAALRWSLTGAPPDETAHALWGDAAGLLRLIAAVRAQALAMALRSGETPLDPSELADAGALLDAGALVDAGQAATHNPGPAVDAGMAFTIAAKPGALAPPARALFEPVAVAALIRPWLERAAELGDGAALLERARLRAGAGEGDAAGAMADLGAAVASGLGGDDLDEAQALREELLAREDLDGGVAANRAQPLPAPSATSLAEPVASCTDNIGFAAALSLGAEHELRGELSPALVCDRLALQAASDGGVPAEAESRVALTRLSRAAVRAPVELLAPLQPELARAELLGIASASLAQARALSAQGRIDEALAAVGRFFSATRAPGFIEPGDAEAHALERRLQGEQARAGAARHVRAMLGAALLFIAALVVFFTFFRGFPVAVALRRDPSLFPAVARAVAELRHDALKHRASALAMLGQAPREEILRALTVPQPASALIAEVYAALAKAADARGLSLRRLRREPIFGPLFLDLLRAQVQLAQLPGPSDARIRDAAARMPSHAESLAALLGLGPRTRLDAVVLAGWIGGIEAELRAQQKPWTSPALELQGLELDFPVAREALAAIFANLLRNAQAAAASSPAPRVRVRVGEERDVIGRRRLELRIGDSSPARLTLEQIESRESGRGLSLVRDLVREWHGALHVRPEDEPLQKSIAASFPQQAGP